MEQNTAVTFSFLKFLRNHYFLTKFQWFPASRSLITDFKINGGFMRKKLPMFQVKALLQVARPFKPFRKYFVLDHCFQQSHLASDKRDVNYIFRNSDFFKTYIKPICNKQVLFSWQQHQTHVKIFSILTYSLVNPLSQFFCSEGELAFLFAIKMLFEASKIYVA